MPSLVQLIFDGIVFGSIVLLAAVGLSLLYGIGNFANFAHGELLTVGAYVTFLVYVQLGAPFLLASVIAIAFTAVLGVAIDRGLLQYHRRSAPLSLLMLTVGVAFVLRSIVRMIWTNEARSYDLPLVVGQQVFDVTVDAGVTDLNLALFVTQKDLLILALGAVFAVLTHLFLTRTKMGIAMRATSANRSLSRVTGINTDNVARITWALSGALAAIGGIFLAYTSGIIYPRMGFEVLLIVFAAVILGGIGSPYGAMVGAYIISIAEQLSVAIPGVGAKYRFAVAFVALIVVLLVKPTGLFGGEWS